MEHVKITIVGAGVVGLALAARLSERCNNIFVIEKEDSFGRGASSRNSEVIHAGIYYPSDSLKAKTCVEGNRMSYALCAKNNIPFKKLGKLIMATSSEEEGQLWSLYKQGNSNGVDGLEIIDSSKIQKLEPNIEGICALFSPESGIIDSHNLIQHLSSKAKENGAAVVYQSKVIGIERKENTYHIDTQDMSKDVFHFTSDVVINAAGLDSDLIAKMVGLDINALGYDLKFCKGQYFRLPPNKSSMIKRLVYPVPQQSDGGLGIHLTPDISGRVRLGPDTEYLGERLENYDVDNQRQKYFYDSVRKFAPFIIQDDLSADTSGIRAKLQGEGEEFRDFVIKEESDNGFPDFINLIGIDSPGLTAAVAIAKYVENLLKIVKN